ncbi:glycosyltransferase [Acidovorax sp. M2(2025)]|uniref:glycosyltransferase n=1 Tax=Acidovorax sp. M2(2025) TaxID=3411355 RepID=UPI003BF5D51E
MNKRFHFIFGLRPQTEPFHLVHYLCLSSCIAVNQPQEVSLHLRYEPFGPWWDRIKGRLNLRGVDDRRSSGFNEALYGRTEEGRVIAGQGISYAHEADFIRLSLLREEGGVYADMDTLFVRPFPDFLYEQACVLGEEDAYRGDNGVVQPSLCNAVIFSQPGSMFVSHWQEQAMQVFDGTWSKHSCQLAARLWQRMPQHVSVAPRQWFYHFGVSPAGIRALLEEKAMIPRQLLSMHLWAHLWWSERRTDFTRFHAGLLDEAYVRQGASTYAWAARQFL